jgi:hypothetical protein
MKMVLFQGAVLSYYISVCRWPAKKRFFKRTFFSPVFRIHDILEWIRIRGSMPKQMDPDSDPDPAFFVIDLQDANKNNFSLNIFSAYYFLKVHFT